MDRRLISAASLVGFLLIALSAGACNVEPRPVADASPTAITDLTSTPQPVVLAQPTLDTKPTATRNAISMVQSITLARDALGDSKEPLNPTTVFAPNSIFHAIVATQDATVGTRFKATWLVANVGPSVAPNSVIDSYELTTDGSHNLDFTLSPKTTWPVGAYRVEIAVNGMTERVVDFTVAGTASKQPTSAPVKASGLITSLTMAPDTQPETKDPINPTKIFTPNSIFHAVVALKNAPKNTRFTATWFAVNIGSGADSNTQIDSTDITADGTVNLDFTLTPATPWPPGTYRVQIFVNGRLDQSVDFSVK